MADFNVNVAGAQGGAQPIQPVRTQPTDMGLNLFAQVGSVLAKATGEYAKNQQALKTQELINSNVSEFAQAQLRIADAVEGGDLNSQEGRMRMRANYTRAIADNPGLVTDLAKVHKDIISTSGLGKVVAEGTDQEQMDLAAQKEASLNGWIPAHLSPDQREAATQSYLQFKRSQEDLKAEQARVSLATSKINQQSATVGLATSKVSLQSARLGLAQKERAERSRNALASGADAYNQRFTNSMDEIKMRLDRGEIDRDTAVQLADNQFNTIQQTISSAGRDAGSDYMNSVVSPMRSQYENTKKFLTGEMSKETLDNQNFINLGKQKLLITSDPEDAKIIAVTNLFPHADLTTMPVVNSRVVKMIGSNADTTTKPADILPDTDSGKQDTQTYLNLLKSNLTASNNGSLLNKEATAVEIDSNISNVLKGIDAYSLSATNPKEYNQVVDFLASPEFGKYSSLKGGLPADSATGAKQVLQANYENQVIPLLKQAWDQSKTGPVGQVNIGRNQIPTGSTLNTTDVIKPTFTGSGVSFQVSPGVTDQRTRLKAADLNKQVAPVLNKLIRMSAHLEGTQDYKRIYNDNYAAIFGEEAPKEETK